MSSDAAPKRKVDRARSGALKKMDWESEAQTDGFGKEEKGKVKGERRKGRLGEWKGERENGIA